MGSQRTPVTSKEPIAIIGIGCRYPGGADTPDAFWRLLVGGVDAVIEIPGDELDEGRARVPRPDRAYRARRARRVTSSGGAVSFTRRRRSSSTQAPRGSPSGAGAAATRSRTAS